MTWVVKKAAFAIVPIVAAAVARAAVRRWEQRHTSPVPGGA
ncbi:hypothetical protein [Dermatobacter hominis]|nr:hypothetical protein [Dermatobacter hominis]